MAEPKILCIGCGSDGPSRHIPLAMCAKCEAAWDEIGSRPPTPEDLKLFEGDVTYRPIGAALFALILALTVSQAQASDLHVEPNTILCHTLAAVSDPRHPGCWRSAGVQRVEIIAALSTASQLRLWSSDGSEAMTVWTARVDADQIQIQGAHHGIQ